MKNKKLNLKTLAVSSFITDMPELDHYTIKGGRNNIGIGASASCPTALARCPITPVTYTCPKN